MKLIPNTDNWNIGNIRFAYNPEQGNPHSEQYIIETSYPSMTPNAFLKAPFIGLKPTYGLEITNVENNGGTQFIVGELNSSFFNIFDNHQVSILGRSSRFLIYNNKFQNSKAIQISSPNTIYLIGGSNSVISTLHLIQKNEFINVHQGIYAEDIIQLTISDNIFRSNALESIDEITLNHPGKNGIVIKTSKYRICGLKSNRFYNIENAISFSSYYTPQSGGFPTQEFGQFEISDNVFLESMVTNQFTNGRLRTAIKLQNVVAGGVDINMYPSSQIKIYNNTMKNVYRGIIVSNFRNRKIIIDNAANNNTSIPPIYLTQSPVANDMHFGVQFTNNSNSADSKHIIKNVKVTGFGNTNPRTYGIYTEMSHRTKIACNSLYSTYHGLYFKGSNPVIETANNVMLNNRYGFTLDEYGVIGQQGSEDFSTGNVFAGHWTDPRYKTATLNYSNAQTSKMYVNDIPLENPDGSGYTDLTYDVTDYFYNSTPASTILFTTSDSKSCVSDFNPSMKPNNHNELSIIEEKGILEKVANNELIFETNSLERYRVAKQQVFNLLKLNPNLMENDAVLQAFYNEHENSNIGKIERIEDALEVDNRILAMEETQALSIETTIDHNYKRFYEIYLAYLNETYTDIENTDLFAIASSCPQLDGAIVFQARALYESLNGNDFILEGACLGQNGDIGAKMAHYTNNETIVSDENDVVIYPNPTKDKIFISCKNSENFNFEIIDQQGRKLEIKPLLINENLIFIDYNLSKGIYLLKFDNYIKKIIVE